MYELEFALPWRPSVTISGRLRSVGRIWVKPPPNDAVTILGHLMFGDTGEPIENELFEFTEPVNFDGGSVEGQVAVMPRQFINNPVWTLDDLLTSSGPVQLLLLNPGKTFEAGEVLPSYEVVDGSTGTMKLL